MMTRVTGALCALALAASSAPAFAGEPPSNFDPFLVIGGYWLGSGDPSFTQTRKVPDFDQRRLQLQSNGSMHCVPTSTTDDMYYLAARGYPQLASDSDPVLAPLVALAAQAWGVTTADLAADQYWGQTLRILAMGAAMDTDGGTSNGDAIDGERDWLEERGVHDFFQVQIEAGDAAYNPGFPAIAMKFGAIGRLSLGWFTGDHHDSEASMGHMVALDGVKLQNSPSWDPDGLWHYTYLISNPSSDEGAVPGRLSHQSTGGSGWRRVVWNPDAERYCIGPEPASADKSWGCIRRYHFLWPLAFLSGENVGTSASAITHVQPAFDEKLGFGRPVAATIEVHGTLAALAYDVVPTQALALVNGDDSVYAVDLVSHRAEALVRVPRPLAVVAGRGGALFVLGAGQLSRVDRTADRGRTRGRITRTVAIDEATEALGYDPVGGRVVVVSGRAVLFLDEDLRPLFDLPTPALDGRGRIALAVDGETGALWLGRAGAATLTRLFGATERGADVARVPLERTTGVAAFTVDPYGRLAASVDGVLRFYTDDGRLFRERMALAGQRAGSILALPLARRPAPDEFEPVDWSLPADVEESADRGGGDEL